MIVRACVCVCERASKSVCAAKSNMPVANSECNDRKTLNFFHKLKTSQRVYDLRPCVCGWQRERVYLAIIDDGIPVADSLACNVSWTSLQTTRFPANV